MGCVISAACACAIKGSSATGARSRGRISILPFPEQGTHRFPPSGESTDTDNRSTAASTYPFGPPGRDVDREVEATNTTAPDRCRKHRCPPPVIRVSTSACQPLPAGTSAINYRAPNTIKDRAHSRAPQPSSERILGPSATYSVPSHERASRPASPVSGIRRGIETTSRSISP